MNPFMDRDFLLQTDTGKKLFHKDAEELPILDFHNHLSPKEIYEDKCFNNLSDVWLGGDHYKWRAMRANGVPEALVTGDGDPYQKFLAWADTVETTPLVREAFGGEPAAIPGVIEAENYDKGGNRFTFYDRDVANKGKSYREDAVDVVSLEDATCGSVACKGYAVGYTEMDEWLEYSVKVASDGQYNVSVNVATASETSKILLLVDDEAIGDTVALEKIDTTWNVYKEIDIGTVDLAAGEHVLKLAIAGSYVNVDWIRFGEGTMGLRKILPAVSPEAVAPRLRKQGGMLFVEKNGMRFDLTGHRIR